MNEKISFRMLSAEVEFMGDDVLVNKAEIIERCLKRIHEIYLGQIGNLKEDQTKQDAIILNLERACQASIDLAKKARRLGRARE